MEVRPFLRALALSLLTVSCSEEPKPRTELVLVVDSDLEIPDELDEIAIATKGPGSTQREASAALGSGEPRPPRMLTLDYQKGELGPIAITVRGKLAGDTVVTREAEVSFVSGRTLVVPLHLSRSCRNVRCDRDETCTEQGCAARALDEDSLKEWDGEKPVLMTEPERDAGQDAGELDAGESAVDAGRDAGADAGRDAGPDGCVPSAETCNRRDDNCDGRIDEGFDLARDVNNCGGCGVRCNTARGQQCINSMCR